MADISGPTTSPLPAGPAGSPDQAAPAGGTAPGNLPVPSPEDVSKFNSQTGVDQASAAPLAEQIEIVKTQLQQLTAKREQVDADIAEVQSLPDSDPNKAQMLTLLKQHAAQLDAQIESTQQKLVELQAQAEGSPDPAGQPPASGSPLPAGGG
jgi:hypothetical protein